MANTNSPFGLQPMRRIDGAMWNDALTERTLAYNYGSAIYRGDPVVTNNAGNIVLATAGDSNLIAGVFWGVEYFDPTQNRFLFMPYWPGVALTNSAIVPKARVITDPMVEFQVRLGNSAAAPANVHVGTGINFISGSGNTGSGLSGYAADYTTIGTGAAKQLKITGWGDNTFGQNDTASAYAVIRCVLNQSEYKAAVAGV